MLRLTWELPIDRRVERVWLAHPPHGRARPTFVGQDELGIGHWRASYERADYIDALNALVAANIAWMAAHAVPPLYEAGLRYMRECCGETWRHAVAVLARQGGDCEDLAAYRVAQLRRAGVPARIVLREVGRMGPDIAFHVLVGIDNAIEDPSEILGATTDSSCDPAGPYGFPCSAVASR